MQFVLGRISFPPASRNIQVDSPYEISRAPDELHYTYLDTFGRPVIVAYKKNLVEQHIQDIVVSSSTALPFVSSSEQYRVLGARDLAFFILPSLGCRALSVVTSGGMWCSLHDSGPAEAPLLLPGV